MTIGSATSAFTDDRKNGRVFINVDYAIPSAVIKQLEKVFPETRGRYSLFAFGGYKKYQMWICLDDDKYLSNKWYEENESYLAFASSEASVGKVITRNIISDVDGLIEKIAIIEKDLGSKSSSSSSSDIEFIKRKLNTLKNDLQLVS